MNYKERILVSENSLSNIIDYVYDVFEKDQDLSESNLSIIKERFDDIKLSLKGYKKEKSFWRKLEWLKDAFCSAQYLLAQDYETYPAFKYNYNFRCILEHLMKMVTYSTFDFLQLISEIGFIENLGPLSCINRIED